MGLRFCGLAVMVNPLRRDTTAVVAQLHDAGIRTVMVTGDHAATAASVARLCGMLCANRAVATADTACGEGRVQDSELALRGTAPDGAPLPGGTEELLAGVAAGSLAAAVTGRGFEKVGAPAGMHAALGWPHPPSLCSPAYATTQPVLAPTGLPPLPHPPLPPPPPGCTQQLQEVGLLEPFLRHAGVFARMSPDDKRALMELLGDGALGEDGGEVAGLGHHVGFCGDGANDVGALKAAHVGVSLCEAEASVAAPLTSKRQTIACMPAVIAEGRCSLVTSYIIFKFVIVYAFIQVGWWGAL